MVDSSAFFVTDARAASMPNIDGAVILTVRGAPDVTLNVPSFPAAQVIAALIHSETATRRRAR